MIAVDTNVLARYLLRGDVRQHARATALFERARAKGEAVFVSDVVLCELVWVLARRYGIPRPTIVATLSELLRTRELAFSATDRLTRALKAFDAGKGDFADYLIREHALAAGCDRVMTFDRAVLREPGFMAP